MAALRLSLTLSVPALYAESYAQSPTAHEQSKANRYASRETTPPRKEIFIFRPLKKKKFGSTRCQEVHDWSEVIHPRLNVVESRLQSSFTVLMCICGLYLPAATWQVARSIIITTT